jgi:hypothetical protein
MDLKEILAISGYSGLFKFVSQGRNGIVVEAFADKKRTFVPATTKVSSLEDIAIFTNDKEVPLKDVFKIMFDKENGAKAIDAKASSPEELKQYMEKILPDYDREKVYVSDIKKLITWYNILHDHELLKFEEEEKSVPVEAETKDEKSETDKPKSSVTTQEKQTGTKSKATVKKAATQTKPQGTKTTKKERSPVKK